MLERGGALWTGREWSRALGVLAVEGTGILGRTDAERSDPPGGQGRGCEGEEEDKDTLA